MPAFPTYMCGTAPLEGAFVALGGVRTAQPPLSPGGPDVEEDLLPKLRSVAGLLRGIPLKECTSSHGPHGCRRGSTDNRVLSRPDQ